MMEKESNSECRVAMYCGEWSDYFEELPTKTKEPNSLTLYCSECRQKLNEKDWITSGKNNLEVCHVTCPNSQNTDKMKTENSYSQKGDEVQIAMGFLNLEVRSWNQVKHHLAEPCFESMKGHAQRLAEYSQNLLNALERLSTKPEESEGVRLTKNGDGVDNRVAILQIPLYN